MMVLLFKTWEHIELTFLSLLIAMSISIPCGIFLARSKSRAAPYVLRLLAMIQTIPGLALIALIMVAFVSIRVILPIPTTGVFPSVVVLTLYALLPILSNTYTGINQVSMNMKNVAKAMGMTPFQVLFYVEIPLSLPVLINGIRIALVSTIGMATLTSLIGSGGLGELIVQGLRTMQLDRILMGTVPAAILAIVLDLILSRVGRWLVPEQEACR